MRATYCRCKASLVYVARPCINQRRGRDMAPSVKCPLHKDSGSHLQHPCKSWLAALVHNPNMVQMDIGESLESLH